MPFDPKLVEAKLALQLIGPEEMPPLAAEALEAGLDGPAICRMAALVNPSGWEVDQRIEGFMAEAGLTHMSCEDASIRVARELARRILSESLDPLSFAKDFEQLYIRAGYPRAIQEVGSLDDEIAIAARSQDELKAYATTLLLKLIATNETEPKN
jgi:hypothetical protein